MMDASSYARRQSMIRKKPNDTPEEQPNETKESKKESNHA
jgi:hypothetical protein